MGTWYFCYLIRQSLPSGLGAPSSLQSQGNCQMVLSCYFSGREEKWGKRKAAASLLAGLVSSLLWWSSYEAGITRKPCSGCMPVAIGRGHSVLPSCLQSQDNLHAKKAPGNILSFTRYGISESWPCSECLQQILSCALYTTFSFEAVLETVQSCAKELSCQMDIKSAFQLLLVYPWAFDLLGFHFEARFISLKPMGIWIALLHLLFSLNEAYSVIWDR